MKSKSSLAASHQESLEIEVDPNIYIEIGGIPYRLNYLPWKDVDHEGKGDRLYGQIDYLKHSINIAADMPKEKQQLTLLHESLHAIINEYNIRELRNENNEHSEAAIDQISLGIYSMLSSLGIELPYGELTNGT